MPGRRQKTNNCLLSVLNLQRWGTSAILSEPSGHVGLTSANKTNLSGVLGGGGHTLQMWERYQTSGPIQICYSNAYYSRNGHELKIINNNNNNCLFYSDHSCLDIYGRYRQYNII